jgi:DNA polymerase I
MMKFILIDGTGLIYRSYYGMPKHLRSKAGESTNAVLGFTNVLVHILKEEKPDYLAVVFDKRGKTVRHKMYEDYKATRTKAPDELYEQIPRVKEVVEAFGISFFEKTGYEADDIIATIVEKTRDQDDMEIQIATGDFDMFQLICSSVKIMHPTNGFRDAEILGTDDVIKKYGFTPKQIPDYKGLHGDSSDNIPGVAGVGKKTATDLLQKYSSLEDIYANLDEVPDRARKKLEPGKESAFFSRKLATLICNVPCDFDIAACKIGELPLENVIPLFEELNFKSVIRRIMPYTDREQAVATEKYSGFTVAKKETPSSQQSMF